MDQGAVPAGRPPAVAAATWWSGPFRALRALGRELFAVRDGPEPVSDEPRGRLKRGLLVIGACLLAVYLAALEAGGLAERLHVPAAAVTGLAVLRGAPVLLVLFRPVAAWWLSLVAAIPYPVLIATAGDAAATDVPWPWTEAGIATHTCVSLVVAYRVAAPVYVAHWVITALLGGSATLVAGSSAGINNTLVVAVAIAVGLGVVAVLRWLREIRRELGRQVTLTEIERTRRTLLEERARIARELHDVVAHHMSLIAVQAEAAPYRVSALEPAAAESFTRIRQNALTAMKELRHILGMLRADDGEPESRYLPQPTLENLERLFDNVRSSGLRVDAAVRGARRPLPQQLELIAFRLVQEALSNAVRHAPGADVEVEVAYGSGSLDLRVANGPAADPRARPIPRPDGAGHGLIGMRERASVLGGTLRAGRRADGWYEVSASLPVEEGGGR
ncbi:MAG TPA: histidine kinase [Pilimelia sp.]|nr:histidine kinase [Pilimelia sp.]